MPGRVRIAVSGAAGRMGGLIVEHIVASPDLRLAAAFDLRRVGEDAGEVAGVKHLGVPITSATGMKGTLKTRGVEVLIDFTVASAAVENVKTAAASGVNLVVGTTGFTPQQRQELEDAILDGNVAAVISPNFSRGVNVFWNLIAAAAQMLSGYDVEVIELHHNQKKDAPSGTAVRAAEILKMATRSTGITHGWNGPRKPGEIGVHAVRAGDITGDHIVLFAGPGERLEIKHQAHNRGAFAAGAVAAARWVANQEPGIYDMEDVLSQQSG